MEKLSCREARAAFTLLFMPITNDRDVVCLKETYVINFAGAVYPEKYEIKICSCCGHQRFIKDLVNIKDDVNLCNDYCNIIYQFSIIPLEKMVIDDKKTK